MPRHVLTLCAVLLCGCTLTPDYQRPGPSVAADFPQGAAYAGNVSPTQAAEDWQQVFRDPVLRQLIDNALANNRDLRTAALNVAAYQAQYRIQRADLLPKVTANGQGQRQYLPRGMTGTKPARVLPE